MTHVSRGGLLPKPPLHCLSAIIFFLKYPLQGMVLQTNLASYHFNKNVKSIYIHPRWVQLGEQTLNSWFVSFIWLVAVKCLTPLKIHPWTTAHQASQVRGFPKQAILEWVNIPSPSDLTDQGLNHCIGRSSHHWATLRNPSPGITYMSQKSCLLFLGDH